jgi:hypothetical protein
MKVVIFYESSNKLTSKLDRKHIFNKSKSDFRIFQKYYFKRQHIEYLFFSHLVSENNVIWLNVIFPKAFPYDFFELIL